MVRRILIAMLFSVLALSMASATCSLQGVSVSYSGSSTVVIPAVSGCHITVTQLISGITALDNANYSNVTILAQDGGCSTANRTLAWVKLSVNTSATPTGDVNGPGSGADTQSLTPLTGNWTANTGSEVCVISVTDFTNQSTGTPPNLSYETTVIGVYGA